MNTQSQLTFLVAEKDVFHMEDTAALLQEMGYFNCLQAEDGTEAWAMFQNFNIDVVLCELDIDEINGLSLLKVIRSNENYASIPFVLLAANVTDKLVMRAGRAGVSDIIVIPYAPEVFKNKIDGIMESRENPDNLETEENYRQGLDLMEKGFYDEALESFQQSLAVRENAEIYYNMGYIQTAQGMHEDALHSFRKATGINNDFARAYKQMADVYQTLGRTEDAGLYYNQAAEIYMDRKQDTEALEIFEAVVNIKPDTTNVFNSLGIIYRRQGRIEDAVEQYKKALKVHPDDEHIYYNLGRAYMELQQMPLAREAFEQALEIAPDFGQAQDMARALQMGLTLSP